MGRKPPTQTGSCDDDADQPEYECDCQVHAGFLVDAQRMGQPRPRVGDWEAIGGHT